MPALDFARGRLPLLPPPPESAAPAQQRTMSAPDENCPHDERKKRPRTAFTASQIKSLESEFEKNKYLSVSKRTQLSKQLSLTETQVRSVSRTQVRSVSRYRLVSRCQKPPRDRGRKTSRTFRKAPSQKVTGPENQVQKTRHILVHIHREEWTIACLGLLNRPPPKYRGPQLKWSSLRSSLFFHLTDAFLRIVK